MATISAPVKNLGYSLHSTENQSHVHLFIWDTHVSMLWQTSNCFMVRVHLKSYHMAHECCIVAHVILAELEDLLWQTMNNNGPKWKSVAFTTINISSCAPIRLCSAEDLYAVVLQWNKTVIVMGTRTRLTWFVVFDPQGALQMLLWTAYNTYADDGRVTFGTNSSSQRFGLNIVYFQRKWIRQGYLQVHCVEKVDLSKCVSGLYRPTIHILPQPQMKQRKWLAQDSTIVPLCCACCHSQVQVDVGGISWQGNINIM